MPKVLGEIECNHTQIYLLLGVRISQEEKIAVK
jgi:hypothetical protein